VIREQKITLGEMRLSGPRRLLVYCADYRCTHHEEIDAERWPDDARLSDLEPRFICGACGRRGMIETMPHILSKDPRPRRRRRNRTRFVSLSADNKRSLCRVPPHWSSIVNGNILNSKGVHVAVVTGHEVFSLKGQKLYNLRDANIYKLNGDLVGHLSDARGTEKRLATDRLFPAS
jgi:hypothetical protein